MYTANMYREIEWGIQDYMKKDVESKMICRF